MSDSPSSEVEQGERRSCTDFERAQTPEAGLRRDDLERDGCVLALYRYLWLKNASGKTCPNVYVPDTVLYKYYQPAYWYFTSREKSAQIKQKHKHNVCSANIAAKFGEVGDSGCTAAYVTVEEASGLGDPLDVEHVTRGRHTVIEHLDFDGLEHFLHEARTNEQGILQKFVEPRTSHNAVIR